MLFLAGGVAFNILLAGVPFLLLLAAGLGYALGTSDATSSGAVAAFVRDLFPARASGQGSVLDPLIEDLVRTRGAAGTFGAVAFLWFSTRFFGSLRSVLDRVFEVPHGRNILIGKLYDIGLTLSATALVVAWVASSAYVALARTRGVALLASLGLHGESVMGPLAYVAGRVATFALLIGVFFAIYTILPHRAVARGQAAFAALTSAILFEAARWAFALVIHRWDPGTLYTGTLAAIVTVVFWVYYAALIVLVGGEASQVRERMRADRLGGDAPAPAPS